MKTIIKGKAFVFGPNIDTDQIYPGRFLALTDPEDVARHAMEGADPNFVNEVKEGDIIVASTNFGCGSSREQAAVALKSAGIGALLADSYGRIFYRNAINLGIPALICPDIAKFVTKGDRLVVALDSGLVVNETTGATMQAQPFSPYVMSILQSGGIKPMIKKQLKGQETK
jgi:3-isopropylmalate/(R)-2-methylmalate dehydratase small subunit